MADINWLDRYERYYGVWTCLYALRADLIAVLELRAELEDPDQREVASTLYPAFIRSSLYWYARSQLNVHNFVLSRGGIWIFPRAEDTRAISDDIGAVWHTSPFETDLDSWLARCVSRSPERLYDGFLELIKTEGRGTEAVMIWEDWTRQCHCKVPIDPFCKLHRMITACWDYVERVEASWYQVAEWYEQLPLDLQGPDLATLRHRFRWLQEQADRETADRRRKGGSAPAR